MRRIYLIKGSLVAAIAIAGLVLAYSTRSHDSAGVASAPEAVANTYRGSKPPPDVRAPNFKLRSYRGKLVRMRDLRSKVVLITFIDTTCTDKCPIIASQVAAGLSILPTSARRQVVALALTVDPRVDSPRSVRRFLAQRHETSLDFLLGTIKELRPIWKAFYVVAAPDLAVFTLGRLPDGGMIRRRAEDLAARLHAHLDGARMRYDDAGQALGTHGNNLRYAALTGTLAIRWEGARRPPGKERNGAWPRRRVALFPRARRRAGA